MQGKEFLNDIKSVKQNIQEPNPAPVKKPRVESTPTPTVPIPKSVEPVSKTPAKAQATLQGKRLFDRAKLAMSEPEPSGGGDPPNVGVTPLRE